MRPLRILFALLTISVLGISFSASSQSNANGRSSADELRRLEARYDTLSSLKYSNAYIAAEKRILEAKIEKLRGEAPTTTNATNRPSTTHRTVTKDDGNSTDFNISGPHSIDKTMWDVMSDTSFISISQQIVFIIDHVSLTAKEHHYPAISFLLTCLGDLLNTIKLDVWSQDKVYDGIFTFNDESIAVKLGISNHIREEAKNHDAAILLISTTYINSSNGPKLYNALRRKTLKSLTIGDVVVPLDGFTESKALFSALFDRLSTKIPEIKDF